MKLINCKGRKLCGALILALSTSLPALADYQSTVLSQGPVGYWRLNETVQPQVVTGPASLGSIAGLNAVYSGFPPRGLPGPFTGSVAVELNGTSQTVEAPYQPALNPEIFTIEIWVNPASESVPGGLYCMAASMHSASPRSGWLIYQSDTVANGGVGLGWNFRMYATNGAATSLSMLAPGGVTPGTWTHLAFTYDGDVAVAYINGVPVNTNTPTGNKFVPNPDADFVIGARSDGGFAWPGQVAEAAYYGSAVSGARLAAHYSAAMTAPATYAAAVQTDSPLVYFRFQEPSDPPADNLGTFGAANDGLFIYPAQAGLAGPSTPPYSGFEATNKAAGFTGSLTGSGGIIRIPELYLDANQVTFSAWVKASGPQSQGAGIVACMGGTTATGLTIDQYFGGFGLGYQWNGNNYGWSPGPDVGLPGLPDGDWAFVALVIEPNQGTIYICDRNNPLNWASAVNSFNVIHAPEAFDAITTIGASSLTNFNGTIDEVAIFDKALSAGDLFTQYAAGVGGVAPRIFSDLLGPYEPIAAGDPLVLTIDAGGTAPLTYVWSKDGTPILTNSSGVFTISSVVLADQGNYSVDISNPFGSAPSSPFFITTVNPSAPVITSKQGFLNRTIYPGGSLHMAITVTGGGLKYQWYKDSNPIASATASSFNITSLIDSDGGTYSVIATNTLGTVSEQATIIVPTPEAGSYAALIVGDAPLAWWRLDDAPGSTNLLDSMGRFDGYYTNLNNTTPPVVLGVPGAIAGDANTAASFAPANKGIGVIPYASALAPGLFTLEAWVKTTVVNGSIVPISDSDSVATGSWWETVGGYWNPVGPGGRAPLDQYNPSSEMASGQWTHLVMLYNGGRVFDGNPYPYIYFVNGQTDGYVWEGDSANSGAPILIGGRYLNTAALVDSLFDGEVDEVAIYDRELSDSEILGHFEARFGTVTPPYFVGAFLPQTVTPGKSLDYSTIVYGSVPIELQWYKNGSPIPGATTESYSIASTALGDSGTYTLWATNSAGVSSQSVAVTVIEPVAYANVTNDVVLHLRFDGNADDSSGRGNNGTPMGSPSYAAGIIGGQAVHLMTETDGLNPANVTNASYITLGNPTDLQFATDSFSVSYWVKLAGGYNGNDLPFIGNAVGSFNNPGWVLGPTYGGGGWQLGLDDGAGTSFTDEGYSIGDGSWHNFVLTVDRTAKFASGYLDGVLVSRTDITSLGSVDNTNTDPITIGQDPTGTYAEDGEFILDDIGIWRRALTALEVAQIESAGVLGGRSFDTVDTSVRITWERTGSSVTLSWPSGTLLQSDSLGASASWSPVPGAAAPSYTFPLPTTGEKYFRVQTE